MNSSANRLSIPHPFVPSHKGDNHNNTASATKMFGNQYPHPLLQQQQSPDFREALQQVLRPVLKAAVPGMWPKCESFKLGRLLPRCKMTHSSPNAADVLCLFFFVVAFFQMMAGIPCPRLMSPLHPVSSPVRSAAWFSRTTRSCVSRCDPAPFQAAANPVFKLYGVKSASHCI